MVREDVSLRRPKQGASETRAKMASFRLPPDIIAYYESEAAATGKGKVDIVLEALRLDRDLGRRLAPVRSRLERTAESMGLSLEYDLAEVISKLVEMGLDAREARLPSQPGDTRGLRKG